MTDRGNLERAILETVRALGSQKTACPSEIARQLSPDHWRDLMADVREAAFRMQADGRIRVTQKGKTVAREGLKGPIRLSLPEEE